MNLQEITYGFPHAAYLVLLALPLAWLLGVLWHYRQWQLAHFSPPDLLQQLLVPRLTSRFVSKAILLCLAWILVVIALMQPMSYGEYPPQFKKGETATPAVPQRSPHEVILLLDASASMAVPDGSEGKTRLAQGQEIADAFISLLQGQWLSLQAFTSEVTLLVPPTTDYLFARQKLQQIQINEGGIPGTSFKQMLSSLHDQLLASPSELDKTVIIISDGGDTYLESLKEEAKQHALDEMLDPWRNKQKHLQINTIAVGSEKGGPVPGVTFEGKPVPSTLDPFLLQPLSQVGGGKYIIADAQSATDIAMQLMQQIQTTEGSQQGRAEGSALMHALYFQFPLGLALLLLAIIWLLPDTAQRESHV